MKGRTRSNKKLQNIAHEIAAMTVRVNKLLPPGVTAEPLPRLAVHALGRSQNAHLFSVSTVVLQFGGKRRQKTFFRSPIILQETICMVYHMLQWNMSGMSGHLPRDGGTATSTVYLVSCFFLTDVVHTLLYNNHRGHTMLYTALPHPLHI